MAELNFVSQFYNLEGDIISERKKNFFKLLKAQLELEEDDLKSLQPRTYLEALFQIDIFIYFNISSKILEVIKGGNEVFISKVLKHPLILRDAIGNLSAKDFVNNFLPCTSHSLRMKILKKASFFLDVSQMDEIVSCLQKRYGLSIAVKLIHTCSSNKIITFLLAHQVKLTPRQIRLIFDKDPEILKMYLQHYKSLTGNIFHHKNVCRYIALKNPKFWVQLQKEGAIGLTGLGRRTSKHFIHHINSDLVNNIEYYVNFLKHSVLVRSLREDFSYVLLKFFPKDLTRLHNNDICRELLKHYPKKNRWYILEQTFMNIFHESIMYNLIYLDDSFIKLFPNKTILNKWAEVHYNKENTYNFLKYCTPSKTIPLIKEKINVTVDMREKTRLIKLLLENCQINQDFQSLEKVLQYIFRHEIEETACDTLKEIRNLFNLGVFKKNHWKHINDIIKILMSKQHYFFEYQYFALNYIKYLMLCGKPFKKELVTFMEYLNSVCISLSIDLDLQDPKIAKEIFIQLVDIYPSTPSNEPFIKWEDLIVIITCFSRNNPDYAVDLSVFPKVQERIKSMITQDLEKMNYSEKSILREVIEYNIKFPEHPIIVIDEALILKAYQYDKNYFSCLSCLEKIVKKQDRSEFDNHVLQLFWDNLEFFFKYQYRALCILRELFRKEPKVITSNIDQILTVYPQFFCTLDIKLMTHLDFDTQVVKCCISKLDSMDDFPGKAVLTGGNIQFEQERYFKIDSRIIEVLSRSLPTKDYIEIVEKRFLPFKERVYVQDEYLKKIFYLQCEVARTLKMLQNPEEVLPTLMKYCFGDYLQSALPSLYSVCHRTSERELYSYIDVLFNRAESVKKHAVYLSCAIMPYDYVLYKLKTVNKSNNVSSRKHIFSATLKYFLKNPSDELLELVISQLEASNKDDEGTFKNLVKCNIPKQYIELYTQKCWYFLEKMCKEDIKVQNYLQAFFDKYLVSPNFSSISWPADFSRHIISNYFTDIREQDIYLNNIHLFVCRFLQDKREQVDNFEFIFEIIAELKRSGSKKFLKTFFMKFYDTALQDLKDNTKSDLKDNNHICLFRENWINMFDPLEMFDEHVLLDLLNLKCKVTDDLIESYAQEVVVYLTTLVDEYGPYIYNKLKSLLLYKLSLTTTEKYLFFYNMLKLDDSALNSILVIDFLQSTSCDNVDNDTSDIYKEIIEILRNSDEPVVSVYFNSFFDNED